LVKVLEDALDSYPDKYNDGVALEKMITETCKSFIEHCPTVVEAENNK
jgi:hypothetical protein